MGVSKVSLLAVVLLIIGTMLVIGCSNGESSTLTKPEDVAEAFLRASDNDDIDAGLSLLSDDVVFRQDPAGIRVEGKAQFEASLKENAAWHHRHSMTSPFTVEGDKVTCTAEVSGDDFDIIGIDNIHTTYEFWIRDGKIYSILVTADNEDWARLAELTSGGIGIRIDVVERGLAVEGFAKNSPAREAGVKSGDVIIAVGGVSCSQMREGEAQLRIRGAAGSTVLLTIIRQGMNAPIDVEVARIEFSQLQFE